MPSGDTERRPRTPAERTSPARERAAERGRTPPGSALGRQARLADASHASHEGGPAAAQTLRPPPLPRPLQRWTADRDRDTLLGELLGPRPHALDLCGAGRCADRDAGSPLRSLSGNCSLLGFYLNVRPETMQRLEENIGSMLFDISLSSLFSSTVSDWATETKHKMNKRDYIKVKNIFCTAKETIHKTKAQPNNWEKILANHIPDKGLIAKIQKALIHLNNKENPQPN